MQRHTSTPAHTQANIHTQSRGGIEMHANQERMSKNENENENESGWGNPFVWFPLLKWRHDFSIFPLGIIFPLHSYRDNTHIRLYSERSLSLSVSRSRSRSRFVFVNWMLGMSAHQPEKQHQLHTISILYAVTFESYTHIQQSQLFRVLSTFFYPKKQRWRWCRQRRRRQRQR